MLSASDIKSFAEIDLGQSFATRLSIYCWECLWTDCKDYFRARGYKEPKAGRYVGASDPIYLGQMTWAYTFSITGKELNEILLVLWKTTSDHDQVEIFVNDIIKRQASGEQGYQAGAQAVGCRAEWESDLSKLKEKRGGR